MFRKRRIMECCERKDELPQCSCGDLIVGPCASDKFDLITTPPISEPRTITLRTTLQALMRVSSGLLSLFSLLYVTDALYSGKFCPSACDLTLNYATFNDTDLWLSRKVRSCRSELRITSLYLCFAQYCEDDGEIEKWIRDESPWCDKHAGVTLPAYQEVVDGWTSHDRAVIRRLDADEAMNFPVLGEVVLPDARFYERAFTTMV